MRRTSSLFSSLHRLRSKSDVITTTGGVDRDEGAALTVVYRDDNPEVE